MTRTLQSWRRTMFAAGALLTLVGAVLMVGGGLYAGRQQYHADGDVMAGIWAGTAGTLGVVTGVVLLKLAVLGPYPKQYAHELPPVGPEVDND